MIKTLVGRNAINYLKTQNPRNNMVPKKIAEDLITLKEMFKKIELISNDVWYDTIHIKGIKEENLYQVISVIQTWRCDELHWMSRKKLCRSIKEVNPITAKEDLKDSSYLRIWWD